MRLQGEDVFFEDADPDYQAELLALGHEPDESGPLSVEVVHQAALARLSLLSIERALGDKSQETLRSMDILYAIEKQLGARRDALDKEAACLGG